MTPQDAAAAVVDGVFGVLQGDAEYKAKFAVAVIDQLIGSDPHALVSSIPGVPSALVETLSDGLLGALEDAILRRLQQP